MAKMDEKPLRAFPPKDLPLGTRLDLRQAGVRPVTLAVTPSSATTPGPIARWFPRPGLPWPSGVPAAGSLASGRWEQRLTRVRPWR